MPGNIGRTKYPSWLILRGDSPWWLPINLFPDFLERPPCTHKLRTWITVNFPRPSTDTCKPAESHQEIACVISKHRSMCTALTARSVNITPYALPLVRFWTLRRTIHGPNKSSMIWLNAGAGLSLASGSSPICRSWLRDWFVCRMKMCCSLNAVC